MEKEAFKIKRQKTGVSGQLNIVFPILCTLLFFTSSCPLTAEEYDTYGGFISIKTRRTGFFRVEKIKNAWWLITPDGHGFFSAGVNHVNPVGFHAPALGYSPYEKYILSVFGTYNKWADVVVIRLKTWGFNTVGSWSWDGMYSRMPYTYNLNLSHADWQKGTFPDVFDTQWEEKVFEKSKKECEPRKNDKMLAGYFIDNELRWGPDWRSTKDIFSEYAALPPGAPGKKAIESFLEKKGVKQTEASPSIRREFLKIVAERLFKTCSEAIRKIDKNHLILGIRFHGGGAPKEVVESAGKYVDVVSINYYPMGKVLDDAVAAYLGSLPVEPAMKAYHDTAKRPIMITEFSFKAMDSGLPNTKGASLPVPAQADRAKNFEKYVAQFIKTPYMVGYHWYCYMDEPKEGRFDGENSNYGLVNGKDEPYEALVSAMSRVNKNILALHGQI